MRLGVFALPLCVVLCVPTANGNRQQIVCRDRFLWPFASTSVWNVPIGSGAVFVPVHLFDLPYAEACALRTGPAVALRSLCPGWNTSWTPGTCVAAGCCWAPLPAPQPGPWCHYPGGRLPNWGFHADVDVAVRASSDDPLVPWISQGGWGPEDRCAISGTVATHVPLPDDFAIGCQGGNLAMGLLLPDNRTLLQMQPANRAPMRGAPLLAQYQRGCPVAFPWAVDILSDAPWGAHGGSGLSSIGGTLRAGELLPGAPPIAHALKLELLAHDYYFSGGPAAPYEQCFAWPALGCDGYAHDSSSALQYNGSCAALKPGALLAIPPDAAPAAMATEPGRRLGDALRAYGAYIVDDTASDSAALCMEQATLDDLRAAYSITVGAPAASAASAAFASDLAELFRSLAVVANNANSTVGGGGTPGVPLAPPICGAEAG